MTVLPPIIIVVHMHRVPIPGVFPFTLVTADFIRDTVFTPSHTVVMATAPNTEVAAATHPIHDDRDEDGAANQTQNACEDCPPYRTQRDDGGSSTMPIVAAPAAIVVDLSLIHI